MRVYLGGRRHHGGVGPDDLVLMGVQGRAIRTPLTGLVRRLGVLAHAFACLGDGVTGFPDSRLTEGPSLDWLSRRRIVIMFWSSTSWVLG